MPRTILHLDLDAFFCAVEETRDPSLRGKPFAVGGRPEERGVVASCSYAARAFGVHSAMPMSRALSLCPGLIIVPSRHRVYSEASKQVMERLRQLTPLVEQISIDEAFLDLSDLRASPERLARDLQAGIRDDLGLPCSIGIAANKLVAKIATEVGKKAARGGAPPFALTIVPPREEAAFLAPLPISRLWGVGEKTATALGEYGVRTIGDLASLPSDALERRLGKHGASLVERAHGIDPDPVAGGEAAKSIGHEHTFDRDTADRDVLERTLLGMADGVAGRLRSSGLRAVTITLKLRDSGFHTITRQTSLEVPADLTEPIFEAALTLLRRELHGQRIRLVGVTASNFRDREQMAMFDRQEDPRRVAAAAALDRIRGKYGSHAVTRARLVRSALPAPFERDPMKPVDVADDEPDAARRRERRDTEPVTDLDEDTFDVT